MYSPNTEPSSGWFKIKSSTRITPGERNSAGAYGGGGARPPSRRRPLDRRRSLPATGASRPTTLAHLRSHWARLASVAMNHPPLPGRCARPPINKDDERSGAPLFMVMNDVMK